MEYSPAAAWITDDQGRVEYLNPTYYRMFKLPQGELIGKDAYDISPPDLAREYLENIRSVATTLRVLETIEPSLRSDGTPGAFLVYKFPLSRSGETLVGGMAVDITENRR